MFELTKTIASYQISQSNFLFVSDSIGWATTRWTTTYSTRYCEWCCAILCPVHYTHSSSTSSSIEQRNATERNPYFRWIALMWLAHDDNQWHSTTSFCAIQSNSCGPLCKERKIKYETESRFLLSSSLVRSLRHRRQENDDDNDKTHVIYIMNEVQQAWRLLVLKFNTSVRCTHNQFKKYTPKAFRRNPV